MKTISIRLLDEREASRASRKRAWENLQEIRWVLKDIAGIELPPPARKTIDLEGRLVKDGVRTALRDRQDALSELVEPAMLTRRLQQRTSSYGWPEVSVPFFSLPNFADLLSSSLAILLSSLMEHRQRKTAPHRGSNDSAALAAQCARKLLELRTVTGKTQKQLAARLRMTESMISRLERGDHVPSLKTLCRFADAFGRHLEIVFHEHEHVHADGTRHIHPHCHYDPEHQHDHQGEK